MIQYVNLSVYCLSLYCHGTNVLKDLTKPITCFLLICAPNNIYIVSVCKTFIISLFFL